MLLKSVVIVESPTTNLAVRQLSRFMRISNVLLQSVVSAEVPITVTTFDSHVDGPGKKEDRFRFYLFKLLACVKLFWIIVKCET